MASDDRGPESRHYKSRGRRNKERAERFERERQKRRTDWERRSEGADGPPPPTNSSEGTSSNTDSWSTDGPPSPERDRLRDGVNANRVNTDEGQRRLTAIAFTNAFGPMPAKAPPLLKNPAVTEGTRGMQGGGSSSRGNDAGRAGPSTTCAPRPLQAPAGSLAKSKGATSEAQAKGTGGKKGGWGAKVLVVSYLGKKCCCLCLNLCQVA